jgi:thiol-disulfide isomerase/thioredoxin
MDRPGALEEEAMMGRSILFVLAALSLQQPDAETRIVEYLKANVKPGERVVVSDLYNNVFTTSAERAALNRLFNTFFKIPLFAAQYHRAAGKPPTLAEIGEQFRFQVPGQTDVMLRIMESDPRMPKFLERDEATGEIAQVDVEAILKHPRFGKALERTITGWESKPAPAFTTKAYDGKPVSSEALAGKPYLVYFWFTNCPPCIKTSPLLVELHEAYAPKGFEILAANADTVLELPYTEEDRAAYVEKLGIAFTMAHMTPEMQQAYGTVSVYPTLFFVDRKGVIVKHFVNFQEKTTLEAAVQLALE